MRRGATWVVVWGGWAALTAASLALIVAFGSNAPYLDGWDMVPTLTGEQPVTLEWLWSQHNEFAHWLLVSTRSDEDEVRSFTITDGVITEEPVVLT